MQVNARRILVPVDGDPSTERAFRWGCQLARENKADIHAIHVIEVPFELPLDTDLPPANREGEDILARVEAIGKEEKCKVDARLLQSRQAGPAIVQETDDHNMDLVILGVRYHRHLGSYTLGSTAAYILKYAPCQVICWRERGSAVALSRG